MATDKKAKKDNTDSSKREDSQSQKKSWYSKGYAGVDQEKARRAAAMKPKRFWMPSGATNHIVFLDDEPFCIYEYNWFHNDSWQNWATMSEETEVDAVFRSIGLKPYFV